MAVRHDGMVDVELDDEPDPLARPGHDGHGSAAHHPVHSAPATPSGRRLHRARLLRAMAAAIAVGTLVIATLTLRDAANVRADDDRVAALAQLPGLVGSLRAPLAERWRGPASAEVTGAVALVPEPYQGTIRTIARDTSTGAVRWVVPRALTPGNQPPGCRLLSSVPTALTCEIPGRPGIQAANTDEALGSTPGVLATLDEATGALLDLTVLPVGTLGWAVVDGDLVTARVADGALAVERRAAAADERRWSRSIALPPGALARALALHVENGFVLIDGATAVVLDAENGTVLGPSPVDAGGEALRVTSGRLGFTVWQGTTGTWHDRRGLAGALLTGRPVEPAIDDGSGGALVLVRATPSVFAIDVLDGGTAWSRSPIDEARARLGGLLLLEGGDRLLAVDAASGATRWIASATTGPAGSVVVTDGVRVLVVVTGEDTRPRMAALELADGTVAWSSPMPAGTTTLSARDGAVVASGDGVLVVLG